MTLDLKKRLASLDRLTRKPQPAPGVQEAGKAGDPEELAQSRLGLQRASTGTGPCFLREFSEPLLPPEGDLPDLSGFLSRPGGAGVGPEDVLFLDTETTGLAGGTGTLVFLVGASWWRDGVYRTRQYFLCGPGGEAPMLAHLHELARRFRAVASFNGASFDLPLLRTRALLNRMDHPWEDLESWDLLVPSRRLWKRVLPDCRQQTVEARVCGLARQDLDIPGHLIPQTWFDFLKQGLTGDLERVLYHNRADMLGLGHIFVEMVRLARDLGEGSPRDEREWRQAWALALVAERRGDVDLSIAWMLGAHRAALPDEGAWELDRFVADQLRILKRSGDWTLVAVIIEKALAAGRKDWWLHREAAILFEHRLVDLARARRHAAACGDEHRLARVQMKFDQSGEDQS